jgi:hypothetical protein
MDMRRFAIGSDSLLLDTKMHSKPASCPAADPALSVFDSHGLPLDEATASIIHELNEPLCAILLNASAGLSALKSGEPSPEMVEECLVAITEQCKRVVGIIRGLRVITRKAPLD